ncbi:hypothetical protein LGR54_20035 [Ancylobacter sp. Lp-2]|uniref:hypothetical protein n=1 Tax=Ancylobacter sp. Lp-2 TaxID=2881339 RepID=UPI001E3570E0|nr:hypothetical protein [Ancylobacter sp. Lp-2]MCB4770906.1 hypothetical protein [Ancylobacter sp. Lp-2]
MMKLTHLAAGALAAALGVAALAAPAAAQTYMRNYGSAYPQLPGPSYDTGYYVEPGYVEPRYVQPGYVDPRERVIVRTPQRYVTTTQRYMVVEPADPYGAEIVHGYGNKPLRVMPSLTRSGYNGQPCYTVEKTSTGGLLRSYTYCR